MCSMGRRKKLTPELTAKLVEAIQIGCTYKHACEYAGIAVSTFYAWMENGRNQKEDIFIEFLETIQKANSRSVIANLAIIQRAAKEGSWQASAWVLERRHGMTKQPEQIVETNININQINVEQLLEDVKVTEHLIAEIIADPMIDLDE